MLWTHFPKPTTILALPSLAGYIVMYCKRVHSLASANRGSKNMQAVHMQLA